MASTPTLNLNDPLAGLATAAAKPAKVAKTSVAVPVVASAPNVIPFRKGKKRATGAEFKAARDFARSATGYDNTSPIWGQRLPQVLMTIESRLNSAIDGFNGTLDPQEIEAFMREALALNQELQKRIATNAVVGAQLR